jgi:hypothetical protein
VHLLSSEQAQKEELPLSGIGQGLDRRHPPLQLQERPTYLVTID